MAKSYSFVSERGKQGSCERMWVMLTRQLSRVVSNFKALDTKRGERGKGCGSYVDDFGCRLVAFAGGNPPGSVLKPPEGRSNLSRNTFSLAELERGSHKLN